MPHTALLRSTDYWSANAIQDGSGFRCVVCGTTYENHQRPAWRKHVKVKHPEFTEWVEVTRNSYKMRNKECPLCEYKTQINRYLKEHMVRMHSPSRKERPERQFRCPYCPATFSLKTNMCAHKRKVCKNKPMQCSVVSTCLPTPEAKENESIMDNAKVFNPFPTLILKLYGLSQSVKCINNFTKSTISDRLELSTEKGASEPTMCIKGQPLQLLTENVPSSGSVGPRQPPQIVEQKKHASKDAVCSGQPQFLNERLVPYAVIPALVPPDQPVVTYGETELEYGVYDIPATWTQEEEDSFKVQTVNALVYTITFDFDGTPVLLFCRLHS